MLWRNSGLLAAAIKLVAVVFLLFLTGPVAIGQALSVLPVNVFFSPGQKATSLTVTNQGSTETAIQIRAYAWSQKDNDDPLEATGNVVVSPPIARIAPGATQIVRLILRQSPESREATYRILIDQIPPPAEPGTVHLVLRLSIPIFVKPPIRAFPDVQFHLERDAGNIYLVAVNAGLMHEVIRNIEVTASDGSKLKPTNSSASPYVLSGAMRRWQIATQDSQPSTSETLRLTAHSEAGAIDQQVRFAAAR